MATALLSRDAAGEGTGGAHLSPGQARGSDYIPAYNPSGGQQLASHSCSDDSLDLGKRLESTDSRLFAIPVFSDGELNADKEPSDNEKMNPSHQRRDTGAMAGAANMHAYADQEGGYVPATTHVQMRQLTLAHEKTAAVWEAELIRSLVGKDRKRETSRPAPRGAMIECKIKRVKNLLGTHCSFQMHLENGDIFLLAARRRKKSKTSSYVISQDADDLKRDTTNCIAKLKANFTGTEYILWARGNELDSKKGYGHEHLCINFKQHGLHSGGPRTMFAGLPVPESNWQPGQQPDGCDSLSNVVDMAQRHELPQNLASNLTMFATNPAEWDEEEKSYVLDFKGRVKQASVKNFQLVQWNHTSETRGPVVCLQFGKVEDDLYALDFQYPFSIEVAFAIALASIDTKLCYSL